MRGTTLTVLAVGLLAGCVTMTPEAERVQVHAQTSSLVADCERLGPVSAEASRGWGYKHAVDTAKIKIREETAKLGGDTVVLLNLDEYATRVQLQGVAMRCYRR